MRRISLGVATIATLALISPPMAHEHATGIVKERMDGMEAMAKSMKSIGQRIKTGSNLDAIPADAKGILPMASKIAEWFPAGSHQHPSEARAEIWLRWSDFQAKGRALEEEVSKLGAIDASDPKAVATQARAVTRACGACHELYREKKRHREQ